MRPTLVVLGGYAARDAAERQRHVDELADIGILPPEQVPAFWAVGTGLLTTGDRIEVQGERTSGEIEFALVVSQGRVFVAAASDQTDREFEVHSIPRSKQMCAKVLSRQVVALDDVVDSWDDLELRSDVRVASGPWRPYQRASVSALMHPRDLMAAAFGHGATPVDGTVLLSGTVSLIDGVTTYDDSFRGALALPSGGTELTLEYDVAVLPEHHDHFAPRRAS
ncbi:MAG TPA: DUF2848 family protein [Actinomycetales bacterium]|nr:DUF2848 family protein [Actinomycetales bacterium]